MTDYFFRSHRLTIVLFIRQAVWRGACCAGLLVAGLLAAVRLLIAVSLLVAVGAPNPVQGAVNSEAYLGEPFGVGRVTIDVLRGEQLLPLSDERFTVDEAHGRVLFPTLKQEPVRRLLRGLLDREAPRKVTLYYLFQGTQPFDISAYTPNEQGVRIKPQRNAARHKQLLGEWWEQTTRRYQRLLQDHAYPPVAENFLVATLSRRLDLPIPEPRRGFLSSLLSGSMSGLLGGNNKTDDALSSLFVNEAHCLRVDRTLVGEENNRPLEMQPLPESIEWPDSEPVEQGSGAVGIEPLATHVPAECFYVRFGNFTNYLWFRDLNKKWQGDLGNMLLRRGIKRSAGDRIQQQLSLRESALAKVLGPQVIADAAIIGLDHYVAQGAAIGILFQAKNELLLTADMMRQRRESLTHFDDASEETLEIAGQPVSLIATPGGEVRSYYVRHEGFHLITTSRTLVERFLQAGKGDRSLATLGSFQRFRREFPLERDDTVVAFVSEAYWRKLCSPHGFIENLRRVQASRESLLLELARYAASCEGLGAHSVEELIATEILPAGFQKRSDGSAILEPEQGAVDSRRGARGYYLPIADTPVEEVSAQEAAMFQRFADQLRSGIGEMPPIAAAVHRTPAENGERESISVELHAQGAIRQKLGKVATWLGQPAEMRLQPVAGDLLAFEAVVDFPGPAVGGGSPEHHLFGALRDYRAPLVVKRGTVQTDGTPAELVRGYLGAWPKPGLLDWLTGSEAVAGPEPQQIGAEMWQAKQAEFLVLAFKSEVLQEVLPQLHHQIAERTAQLWLRLEDLTDTQMADNVNTLGYMRTRETTMAGSRFMNALANQLRVPRDQCRAVAQRLVDGTFVCPLGGDYQLYAPERGLEVWISSALPKRNRFSLSEVPADFRLPLLHWFRGLTGDLRLDGQALHARLEITMTAAALP